MPLGLWVPNALFWKQGKMEKEKEKKKEEKEKKKEEEKDEAVQNSLDSFFFNVKNHGSSILYFESLLNYK